MTDVLRGPLPQRAFGTPTANGNPPLKNLLTELNGPMFQQKCDEYESTPELGYKTVVQPTTPTSGSEPEPKKVYYCQRCLNHGRLEPRKNHKCECPFATCTCDLCILVEKRRKLNSQLHDLEGNVAEEKEQLTLMDMEKEDIQLRTKGERIPNCQKCGQHGKRNRLKGHKRECPYRYCPCEKCDVVTQRQKLMADQIKIRRKQRKNTIMNMTRDRITSTINAAAALSAGQMNFPFGNINALIYNQLKTVPSSLLTPPASSDGSSYSPTSSLTTFTSSPELLAATMPSSPPRSPQRIAAPVPINPTAAPTAFPFQLLNSEALLQSLLANYMMMEQQSYEQPIELNNSVIDVCSV